MAGKERTMKDKEYCVRFPLDFFDDAHPEIVAEVKSGKALTPELRTAIIDAAKDYVSRSGK